MAVYSSALQHCISNSSECISLEVTVEVKNYLLNRPVVVLKNNGATVCYLRPGIEKDIQAAFIRRKQIADIPNAPCLNSAAVDFTDLSKPPRCSKNPADLQQLLIVCEKVGLLRELYLEIITHDIDYFQQIINLKTPAVGFSPLGLEECACKNNKNNRIFSNSRYLFEQHFIAHCASIVTDKSQPIKCLSLASGKLLQDWKLIGLLLQEGYTQFEWILVDPVTSKDASLNTFREFFTKIPDISVTISAYNSLVDVPKQQLHIVAVIDPYDSVFDDILKGLDYIAPSGKILFSGGNNLFEIGASGMKIIHQPPQCKRLFHDIAQAVPKDHTGTLHLAVLHDRVFCFSAIDALQNQGVTSIHLLLDDDEGKHLYAALFPSITFDIEIVTSEALEARIKEKQHFDFIISEPLDQKAQARFGVVSFPQVDKHTLCQTTTAYLIGPNFFSTFRWDNNQ